MSKRGGGGEEVRVKTTRVNRIGKVTNVGTNQSRAVLDRPIKVQSLSMGKE